MLPVCLYKERGDLTYLVGFPAPCWVICAIPREYDFQVTIQMNSDTTYKKIGTPWPAYSRAHIHTRYSRTEWNLRFSFHSRLQNFEKRLFASSCLYACLSVCLSAWKNLGSQWNDIYDNLYCSIFRKYVQKIKIFLKSNKNNGQFTWRPVYIYDNISLNS